MYFTLLILGDCQVQEFNFSAGSGAAWNALPGQSLGRLGSQSVSDGGGCAAQLRGYLGSRPSPAPGCVSVSRLLSVCPPAMPSPVPLERFLPRDLSPSVDLRPCSSPLELSRGKPGEPRRPAAASRLPPRLAWCRIDWEQVRLLEPLGSGGFGAVYRATYRGETVALKKVKRCCKNRLASRQSFWAELNAARLRHPHVVRILAASAFCPGDPGSPGTVIMEYAGSGTLHRRIYGRGPPLGRECCLRYSGHIAEGLRFLHRGGVVHLDLKPANVLLAPGDLCKIGDFGCSQRLRDGEGDGSCTQLRHLGGTYTHRAPELLRGEPVTAKADIYSFAITLWQMVSRELPYVGDRQCVLYAVVAHGLRPNIGQVFSGTEEGIVARPIVESCWTAKPGDRPSAEELLYKLTLLQGSFPMQHPSTGLGLPQSPYPGQDRHLHAEPQNYPYSGDSSCSSLPVSSGLTQSPHAEPQEPPCPGLTQSGRVDSQELPQSPYPGQVGHLHAGPQTSPCSGDALCPSLPVSSGRTQPPHKGPLKSSFPGLTQSLYTGLFNSPKFPQSLDPGLLQPSISTFKKSSLGQLQSPSTKPLPMSPLASSQHPSVSIPSHPGLLQGPPPVPSLYSGSPLPKEADFLDTVQVLDTDLQNMDHSSNAPCRTSEVTPEQSTLQRTCLLSPASCL